MRGEGEAVCEGVGGLWRERVVRAKGCEGEGV